MNIFDIIIILLLIMFTLMGFKRGVIKEGISLIGIIFVFIISFSLKGYLGNVLCKYLPFFNFSGNLEGMTSLNILLYQLIGFFLIYGILFSIYQIILKASNIIQKLFDFTIVFILPSKILGACIAFLSGIITIFMVLLVLLIPLHNNEMFINSNLVNQIIYKTPILSSNTKNISDSMNEVYALGEKVSTKKISVNDANLQTIDIMLKYKIVDTKTIEQLVVLNKLDDIENINTVLNKYK